MDALKCKPVISLTVAIQQLGLLCPRDLNMLLRENPQLLRSQSIELVKRGLITAHDLHRALARTAGIVEVDVAGFDIAPKTCEILPLHLLRKHELVLLGELKEALVIASWCPTSEEDLHSHLFTLTSRNVRVVWGERSAILTRLERMESMTSLWPMEYDEQRQHGTTKCKVPAAVRPLLVLDDVAPEEGDIEYMTAEAVQELSSGTKPSLVAESAESSTMMRMLKRLIMDAKALHASDIHIETNPGEEFTRIRLRRDGDLALYQTISPQLCEVMISRIKAMARLDIHEHRRPQDGRISLSYLATGPLELHVTIMPTHGGMEDVVIPLEDSVDSVPLAMLALQPWHAQALARMSRRSCGLILVAGPTGSGKRTTLHSLLGAMNTEEKKIWTAEDPIRITQHGLRQVQVNPRIGLTFSSAMQGFLRADPDIIMIGEIRDQETASVVIEAALTGHLVLSSLHTNSSAESVIRLLDLGMEAMSFADALVGIVAQRLVRGLCQHCAQEQPLAEGRFDKMVKEYVQGSPLTEAEGAQRLLAAAGVTRPEDVREKIAKGCTHCEGKGYKGRIGIYEILENGPALSQLIQHNAQPTEIYTEAIRLGMHSLRHDALQKWLQGTIDLVQARAAYL
jgi:type II secretory ATPase GspE/PulE/Tfp pilus assembly ATPase PilB-like protein